MNRKVLGASLLLLVPTLACAGDDSDSQESGSAAGSVANSVDEPGVVACGAMKCRPPDGYTGETCCKDALSATCGLKTAPNICNHIPPQTEPNCPDGTVASGDMLLFARGCCISDTNECGVNILLGAIIQGLELPVYCRTLAEAEAIGMVSIGTTFTTSLPAPTRCDGTPIE